MKPIHRSFITTVIIVSFVLTASFAAGQAQAPKAETPVLLASCGQSPGPVMLKVILQKLGLKYELNALATPADLKAKAQAGTPYKSLVIVMGASLKGMGAAGISIDDELKRSAELIDEARKEGIKIIGAHIEGMKRRSQGAAAGDTTDEQTIDAVAPNSDLLIINKEGDSDGRFTTISKARNIPMIVVEKNLDLVTELGKLFGKS
jgi:ABC-type proline/glycine betaine transport system substrate-binding protein